MVSTLLLEGDKVVPGQEKYNMATFMMLFFLITIEVVLLKVVINEQEFEGESPFTNGLFDFDDWFEM